MTTTTAKKAAPTKRPTKRSTTKKVTVEVPRFVRRVYFHTEPGLISCGGVITSVSV
jgi:hypothetical protein